MDKFLTFEGEQPIWLNDFNFMYNAVKNAIGLVANAFAQNKDYSACVLYGCELKYEGDKVLWTDGIILLDGEILPVRAGSIDTGGNSDLPIAYNIVETYDPEGERLFKNGEKHNCYQKRHVTISSNYNEHDVYEVPRLEDMWHEKEYSIYRNNDSGSPTYGTNVVMQHPFGSGYYVNGIFKVAPVMGVKIKNIIPKTDISRFNLRYDSSRRTLTTMTFVNAAGTSASVYPIIITFSSEENSDYMQVDFAQETSLSMGEGQFYCRINGSGWLM